jgi:hypothetical protein
VPQLARKACAHQGLIAGREVESVRGQHLSHANSIANSPPSALSASNRKMTELPVPLYRQFAVMLLIAVAVACASWTVTHEEVFREPREACKRKSERAKSLLARKFYYLFTCEYCFSHYIAALALAIFQAPLLYSGWRGYLLAWFTLVWLANFYMSLFNRLRLEIKHENVEIAVATEQAEKR